MQRQNVTDKSLVIMVVGKSKSPKLRVAASCLEMFACRMFCLRNTRPFYRAVMVCFNCTICK